MKPGDRVVIEATIVGAHMDAPEAFITERQGVNPVSFAGAGDWSRLEVSIHRVEVTDTREVRLPRGLHVHEIDLEG